MIELKRRAQAPESLQRTKAYDGEDVRDALETGFKRKCYLCEGPTGGTFNVEHLRPKAESNGFPALRQSWTNLFPAHGQSCNQRRVNWDVETPPPGRAQPTEVDGRRLNWPQGGMLDCAAPDARIEWRLMQRGEFGLDGPRVFFEPRDPGDTEAVNTAVELRHIHGDVDDPGRHGRTIREQIQRRYIQIQERLNPVIMAYFGQGADAPETRMLLRELAALLGLDTPYAAVLRGTLRRQLRRDGFGEPFITALGLTVAAPAGDPTPAPLADPARA